MAGRIELAVFGHTTRDFIVTYDGRLQLGYLGGGGMNAAAGGVLLGEGRGSRARHAAGLRHAPRPARTAGPASPASTSRGCG